MRALVAGLVGVMVGVAGTWLVFGDGTDRSTPASDASSVPTPRFVGVTASVAHCAMQRARIPLVVDDRPPVKASRAVCTGRAMIQPDPPVLRQTPPAGAPLRPGQAIQLYTACYRKRCL